MKYRETQTVIDNRQVAFGIWRMRVSATHIAGACLPGQFVHVCPAHGSVQFLRMPFAISAARPQDEGIEIVYQVVGEGTRQLSGLHAGDALDIIGPLGHGWDIPDSLERALVVAGGVGAPALTMLVSELAAAGVCVDAVMGAQSADRFACVDEFETACTTSGGRLVFTTDDGSLGTRGFATAESTPLIEGGGYGYLAVCGPYPMMRAVVAAALEAGIRTQVSMERLMACGVGACLSCVVDTKGGKRRCCVDGPVFDAEEVIWR